jgi:pilus assembly protein Flp/PilA
VHFLLRLFLEEHGPTTVEYAVMLALIVVACLGGIYLLGEATGDSFANARDKISQAMNSGS